MTRYELLRNLHQSGVLNSLYCAGYLNLKSHAYRDIYESYQAVRATPHCVDNTARAVRETARTCGVSRQTVERAVKEMEQQV